MMGVQCMMALSAGKGGLSATPEPTKGLAGPGLGLENSMIVRTQVKHRLQRKLFLCSSTPLGKTGLLFAEWTQLLYIRKGAARQFTLSRQQASVHNEALPRPTGKASSVEELSRKSVRRLSWGSSQALVASASLEESVKDTDVSPPLPDILVTKYFRKGRWAQVLKETLEGKVQRWP